MARSTPAPRVAPGAAPAVSSRPCPGRIGRLPSMSTLPPDLQLASPRPLSGTDHDALPPGTRFGEFEIIRVLGVGGFGIVYLARDHSLEREVALKEYMPASLAARGARAADHGALELVRRNLRDRPALVRQRGAPARPLRPSVAGQGLPLLGRQRHRLHGDAVPAGRDAARHAPAHGASARRGLDPQRHHADPVGARAAAPRRRLSPRHRARQHPAAARRAAGAARLRRGAARHQRPHPVAHRDPQAELRADRAVRRDDAAAPGPVDRPLRARRRHPLPAVRRAAGAGDGARGAGRRRAIENRIVPGVSPRFLEAVSWMLAIRPNQRPQSGEQLRAVLDGNAADSAARPARHHDPAAIAGAASASAAVRADPPVEPTADPTRIKTAHMPTHLPTAHVAPPGQSRPDRPSARRRRCRRRAPASRSSTRRSCRRRPAPPQQQPTASRRARQRMAGVAAGDAAAAGAGGSDDAARSRSKPAPAARSRPAPLAAVPRLPQRRRPPGRRRRAVLEAGLDRGRRRSPSWSSARRRPGSS